MMLRLNLKFFCVFLIIFVIEVVVAIYIKDSIIRPYVGDVVVVILMYYFIKSFIKIRTNYLIINILMFTYTVKIGQYFHLVKLLHLQNNKIKPIIIGSSFSWGDIVSYTVGAAICYQIDRKQTNDAIST